MWTILKSTEFLMVLFVFFFTFWFFGCEAHGILVPHPGIKPAPPALEGKVLTTGLPRKSHLSFTFKLFFKIFFLSDILCVDCNTWSIFINVIKHSEFISTTLVCGFHFFYIFYISSVCCFCLCTSFPGLPWLSATDWWFKMIGIYSPRVQEAFWKSRASSAALFPVEGAEGRPPFPHACLLASGMASKPWHPLTCRRLPDLPSHFSGAFLGLWVFTLLLCSR